MENQRVIRADAERTRGQEKLDKDLIELILTKYCKNNNIKYKQGLNEVINQPYTHFIKSFIDCRSLHVHDARVLKAERSAT
jgi:hypothetical protein